MREQLCFTGTCRCLDDIGQMCIERFVARALVGRRYAKIRHLEPLRHRVHSGARLLQYGTAPAMDSRYKSLRRAWDQPTLRPVQILLQAAAAPVAIRRAYFRHMA